MSLKSNPDYVRSPIYNFGTKIIKTDANIEYCVEYATEDKKQTRLLWFKESGNYIRLNAKEEQEETHTFELI
tara:strand:- start:269 stop:484 length:216 start_codon:yes stop_codon:yes gene_type:complete